ncbi:MAG TPA: YdeI/OmpD-associated family protein [Chitinophagaceae bacterium]
MPGISYKTTHPKTRYAWRKWLEKNHSTSPGVWMIYYKKETGKRKFDMADAVEEALCFGWIDSTAQKLDDERTMQKFTPRKPKSVWSKINKQRIEKLIEQELMTPAGMSKIKEAKKNGSWDTLNNSDFHAENNSLPGELRNAFSKSKKALENFQAFPPGYRKRFLFWIDSAKTPETKAARIKQTLLMAAANKKPGLKGFKL